MNFKIVMLIEFKPNKGSGRGESVENKLYDLYEILEDANYSVAIERRPVVSQSGKSAGEDGRERVQKGRRTLL
jgi:hypothetical protein